MSKENSGRCPGGEFLFDDALHSSSGAFRCIIRGRQPTDASMDHYDFPVCEEKDCLTCYDYLKKYKKVS